MSKLTAGVAAGACPIPAISPVGAPMALNGGAMVCKDCMRSIHCLVIWLSCWIWSLPSPQYGCCVIIVSLVRHHAGHGTLCILEAKNGSRVPVVHNFG